MTIKDKIIFAILSLITLGIYPIIILNKKNNKSSNELSNAEKISVNVERIRECIGGSINISGTEYTHTKVKIFLKDKTQANLEELQNIKGISGVFASSKYITIIVGNQAKKLASEI